MLPEDSGDDLVELMANDPRYPCPGESTLAPWIAIHRLAWRYTALGTMKGTPLCPRILDWLEADLKRWHDTWLGRAGKSKCWMDTSC
jgi:hypothetical protein